MHYPKITLFRVQVVPGVQKCRHRSCELPRHGLDPRIAHYVAEAGLEGLFKVPNMELDHALITALSVMPLQFLNPISDAKKYSWGSGALA